MFTHNLFGKIYILFVPAIYVRSNVNEVGNCLCDTDDNSYAAAKKLIEIYFINIFSVQFQCKFKGEKGKQFLLLFFTACNGLVEINILVHTYLFKAIYN